jgi:hypothetical protein|tara:strand:+ start:11947 stop:12300 length:354 start_codon:yes stop_codon:yes gene_type:complete
MGKPEKNYPCACFENAKDLMKMAAKIEIIFADSQSFNATVHDDVQSDLPYTIEEYINCFESPAKSGFPKGYDIEHDKAMVYLKRLKEEVQNRDLQPEDADWILGAVLWSPSCSRFKI